MRRSPSGDRFGGVHQVRFAARVGMAVRASFFTSHNLLSGLPREYTDGLLARASAISLRRGETLFETGAAGDGCFWLEQGVLKVSVTSVQGTERILAILGPGAIV